MKKRIVLAGGSFNILHKGHEYFLKKARTYGDYLIVVLTNDFNNKKPYAVSYAIRKNNLKKLHIADKIVKGYKKFNLNKVLKKYRPDIIALGYDQNFKINFKNIKHIHKLGNHSSRKIHAQIKQIKSLKKKFRR